MTVLAELCLQRATSNQSVISAVACEAQGTLQQATKKNKCIFSAFKFTIQESKAENCVGGDIQIEDRFINKCSPCYGFNYATTVNSNIKPLIKIAEMHLHGAQKET